MSQLEAQRVRVLLGTTGSGKTWKMRELLEREERCILFDLMADPKFENWGVLVNSCSDAVALATRTPKFRIRLQTDNVDQFDFMCKLLVKTPHGYGVLQHATIAVDEVSMFCSPYWAPDGLKDLIRLGRHTGGRFIATTQRPPDIHSLILSQTKEWYLFQMHLPRDVDYLAKFVPEIQRVKTLKTGEFILWKPSATSSSTD